MIENEWIEKRDEGKDNSYKRKGDRKNNMQKYTTVESDEIKNVKMQQFKVLKRRNEWNKMASVLRDAHRCYFICASVALKCF